MLKIKTLITYLCLLIISDSVAVEIFAIGQPCAKILRKVRCATFLRHGVFVYLIPFSLHVCNYIIQSPRSVSLEAYVLLHCFLYVSTDKLLVICND